MKSKRLAKLYDVDVPDLVGSSRIFALSISFEALHIYNLYIQKEMLYHENIYVFSHVASAAIAQVERILLFIQGSEFCYHWISLNTYPLLLPLAKMPHTGIFSIKIYNVHPHT